METRHRKRSRAATSALWEVSPPAECVDGGAVGEDFPPLLEEAQEHLPEAAGGARRMELRCRPARVATSASRRVQPQLQQQQQPEQQQPLQQQQLQQQQQQPWQQQ
jgi:hypothetical protein